MKYLLLIIFLLVFCQTECARILGIFHIPGPSQYLAGSTMMKILAEKGHDITMISVFGEKNLPKNIKAIVLEGVLDKFREQHANMFERSTNSFLAPVTISDMSCFMMESVFNHSQFQKFMNAGEKFDVVIIEQFQSEALKYVAKHFNAPLILYSALDANYWINPYQGNPDSPAYVPNLHLPYSCEMTFFQRLWNSLIYVYNEVLRITYVIPQQDKLLHKYYPEVPHLSTFIYNVSLVLLNSDLSVYEPLPIVPSMVSIGGFHIKKTKDLPEDLKILLDTADTGVIYFSLGSNLRSKDMSPQQLDIMLRTFSELKETVLWKFENDNLPKKPDNVIIRKWFPQNDILAHKNTRLFITHGGIFSTMEAVYHGIPILALPVFGDQYMNSARAEMNGFAKYQPFKELTETSFKYNIKELLINHKYKASAEKRSELMKDKAISPADNLVYWVEYVIRHNGAPHLRVAAMDMNIFQYLLLDILAVVLIVPFLVIFAVKYVLVAVAHKKKKK